ncbi:polysaccharide lyase family 8 super-sandwich domain-containing protein [Nonomuraea soli]|uniref:Chondroitin AC lyase n=1 Tax=Nonomuraea soli TaxID=1032476 RepID=A0A7W0HV38_9ACTN|nr:polysaccharide lyase family 8 super-sandwich domain-containing protein [Nonomuraea soli]MBA2896617.1 chondroitin AC lyase [Nonomuraea soli]
MDTVRSKLLALLTPGADPVPPAPDGRWPDIDYAGRDVADWEPFEHLVRLRALAASAPDQAAIALRAWLDLDPVCPNWWYNQLGAPRLLGDAALILNAPSDAVTAVLARATWENMTGQNLIWAAQVAVRRCLLTGDEEGLADAFRRVEALLVTGEAEGVQPDHSFHQHGPQLYNGGYGHAFAVDTAAFADLAAGTPYAFSPRALAVLSGFLLDGQRWMIHGGRYDIACMGRESSREGNAGQARELAGAAGALARAGAPRADELIRFERPSGARAFWRSDYLAVFRPAWSAAVKLSSTRTVLSESMNGEGLGGRHLCDGALHLWREGEDHPDLSPVLDWRHVPGTTAVQGPGPPAPNHLDRDRGGSPFAGVLSDGWYGVAAMHLERDGMRARKAWFFLDDGYVALGAGITGAHVHTTIDQTALPTTRGYRLLEPGELTIRTGARTGRWSDINRSQPDREITAEVMELWLGHARTPGYAYQAGDDEVAVLANTTRVQAVRHGGLVQAVFHEPGTLEGITVDRAVLLQIDGTTGHVACPLARGGHVTVNGTRVTLPASGETRRFDLERALERTMRR